MFRGGNSGVDARNEPHHYCVSNAVWKQELGRCQERQTRRVSRSYQIDAGDRRRAPDGFRPKLLVDWEITEKGFSNGGSGSQSRARNLYTTGSRRNPGILRIPELILWTKLDSPMATF